MKAITETASSSQLGAAIGTKPAVTTVEPTEHRHAPVAHIAAEKGSLVCLCGCIGTRRATPEEARRAGYCVVCVDLYKTLNGRPLWPVPRKRRDVQLSLFPSEAEEKTLALLKDFFDSTSPSKVNSDSHSTGRM